MYMYSFSSCLTSTPRTCNRQAPLLQRSAGHRPISAWPQNHPANWNPSLGQHGHPWGNTAIVHLEMITNCDCHGVPPSHLCECISIWRSSWANVLTRAPHWSLPPLLRITQGAADWGQWHGFPLDSGIMCKIKSKSSTTARKRATSHILAA